MELPRQRGRTRYVRLVLKMPRRCFSTCLSLALASGCGKSGSVALDSGTAPTTGSGTPTGTASCGPSLEVTWFASWTDDGLEPTDTDGDGAPDFGCGDTFEMGITGFYRTATPGTFRFGMVDVGAADWSGEDCWGGHESTTCHVVAPHFELNQVADCSETSVALGSTTWFHARRDPELTYTLANECGCLTWGRNPEYYEALGCYRVL